MKQLPLSLGLRGHASFESFVAGANDVPVKALQAWLQRWIQRRAHGALASAEAPFYVWGPSGSGKTHLLAALAARLQVHGAKVWWLSAATPAPWEADESADVVLIDQCEALSPEMQQAAFATFVRAGETGVGIVAAGRLPPVDLAVREDLRTRLGWGEVHALAPLSEAESRAALRREADLRGIFLNDDVMAFLLTRFERDLGSLMALLDDIDVYSLANKRQVTVMLVKRMLQDLESNAA